MIVKVAVDFLCDVENPEVAKTYIADVLRRRLKKDDTIVGYMIRIHTEVLEL